MPIVTGQDGGRGIKENESAAKTASELNGRSKNLAAAAELS